MPEPILYILMRTDLESLNPGKKMAQACHAANQMVSDVEIDSDKETSDLLHKWQNQAKGFGTTIVLDGGSEENIRDLISKCQSMGYTADVTIDPEYPIRDGSLVHIIPNFMTCAYVFSEGTCPILKGLKLHA